MAAPPAEPKFEAGPPSFPPPTRAPAQRRFNLLIIGLTFLLAAGLLGGLVIFSGNRPKRVPVAPSEDPVKQVTGAYMAYSAANVQELDQLALAPVQPYLTDAGLRQEQAILQNVTRTGFRYKVTADHRPQVVVYSEGNLASVDDLMLRHTVPIDLKTGQPVGSERSDILHQSYALKKQGERWLIDSVVPIGTAVPEPPLRISYAAASRDKPLDPFVATPIQRSFENYWAAYTLAFKSLNAAPLSGVELDPLLTQDRKLIEDQQQKSRGYVVKVEHNYRIAEQDASTFWVYDTFADSSYSLDAASGTPVNAGPPEIVREGYEFQRVGETWVLATSVRYV